MMQKVIILSLIITMYVFSADTPVRIMPLGDSITYDDAYNPKPDAFKAAYRSFLWYKLENDHYQVDFVGSLNTGWEIQPPFDGDNEGHPGWTSYNIAAHIYEYLSNHQADIVLLMAGANDWSESVSGINDILDQIDSYENNYQHHIQVILARIPNRRGHEEEWMSYFNINLQNLADRRIANGDDIHVIDLEYGAGLDYNNDFQDRTHPNDSGYRKIANVWYQAIATLLYPDFTWLPAIYSVIIG